MNQAQNKEDPEGNGPHHADTRAKLTTLQAGMAEYDRIRNQLDRTKWSLIAKDAARFCTDAVRNRAQATGGTGSEYGNADARIARCVMSAARQAGDAAAQQPASAIPASRATADLTALGLAAAQAADRTTLEATLHFAPDDSGLNERLHGWNAAVQHSNEMVPQWRALCAEPGYGLELGIRPEATSPT